MGLLELRDDLANHLQLVAGVANPQVDRRVADDVGRRLAPVHRLREVEALCLVAADPAKPLGLSLELDPFRDRRHLQAVCEVDDRADEGQLVRPAGDPVDEALVDLDGIDREPPQIAQRRVARSEVVDGDPHAEALQLPQTANRLFGLVRHDALGNLQHQELRRQLAVLERQRH